MSRATVFSDKVGPDLCSPFFNAKGTLFCLSESRGDVYSLSAGGDVSVFASIEGHPTGAVFDRDALYICDQATRSILLMSPQTGAKEQVVAVYEDRPFAAPHSICMDRSRNITFTDAGLFGETGLHNPSGSLFQIARDVLRPVTLNSLSHPTGIALSPNEKLTYVCDMMSNRIIRYFAQGGGGGAMTGSVFIQLSGRVGPSAVAVDSSGNLYVCHYDVPASSRDGRVLIISPEGDVTGEITVPGTPEVSGVAVSPDGRYVYITEKTTGSVHRMALS